ncbi:SAM-dependent methyltransferase [Leptolyngbya sp. FACHB-16]|uniref:SAM-dependent methyltransferase n=1 Tax=unclassified Leptolyngbya TaxID=2650499 RepID=UPI0016884E83|nr:SAM-dependent methyltransferase [Leptolyngbya sp. FACHB-16]MBD2155211.1 SAM-dependent methyltransferase [Leptolyngbya sp. FACHB-16]
MISNTPKLFKHPLNLTPIDLQKTILSVADGPASFNAEGTSLGCKIQSIDPLYIFTAEQIRKRFYEVVDHIIGQVEQTPEDWVWSYHASPDALRQRRESTTELFCKDYEQGKQQGRYAVGELPQLNYQDSQFELGLCSHFLFLYSDHFDETFHRDAVCEMLRVCQDVRIFPLLTLMGEPSPYLKLVIEQLETQGYSCEVQKVAYELQRGGNEMLKITKHPG